MTQVAAGVPGSEYGVLSLLPPLAAIVLAMISRRVYLSLAAGVWLGWTVVEGGNPAAGAAAAVRGLVAVPGEPSNAEVLLFTFGIGSLIAVMESSGGMRGFVAWVVGRGWVTSARRARLLAWGTGLVVFIESNVTILVSSSVAAPLFDRYRLSREKLAYLVDSTSAPVCVLIPFNAWGAYVVGLLAGLGVADPVGTFLRGVPLNFYSLAAVALAGWVAYSGSAWGPMRRAEARAREGRATPTPGGPGSRGARDSDGSTPRGAPERGGPPASQTDPVSNARHPASASTGLHPAAATDEEAPPGRARDMILPILAMVTMVPVGMWLTGEGDLARGSGTTSVLWGVLLGLAVAWLLSLERGSLDLERLSRISVEGAGRLTGMALVLLLALALGAVTSELGTGPYVAGALGGRLPPPLLLPVLFAVTAFIAFATGSSWGTFAIGLPVAIPLATAMGLPPAPFLAAVLSGGIFGDHCSPISDTTVISSLAAGTDHVEHVNTQLPYALAAGAVALVGFGIAGGWLAA